MKNTEGKMTLFDFIDRYLKEDARICVCSQKNMNVLYSGPAGDCYFRLAKTTEVMQMYPYLVDDCEIGILVALTPEYLEWRNKCSLHDEIKTINEVEE